MSESRMLFDDRPNVFGIAFSPREPNYTLSRGEGATITSCDALYLHAITSLLREVHALEKNLREKGRRRESEVNRADAKTRIPNLGWSEREALEARNSLSAFESLWDAPGMEEYDDL